MRAVAPDMAITRIEHTIVVNRPVEEVFAFMERPENMPRWAESVVEAEQTSPGPVGAGTTCRLRSKAMGRRLDQNFVATEYEPNRVYATKTTSGPFPMEVKYTVEPVDGGTMLHVASSADLSGFLRLAGPVLNRMGQRQIRADHANLKKLLESTTQTSS